MDDLVDLYGPFTELPDNLWTTITRCDLSPRFFCIDDTLLCKFESDKI